MRFHQTRQLARRLAEHMTDKAEGRGRALNRLSGSRRINAEITDLSKLPTLENTEELQNPVTGQAYILPGFSTFDGGDVLAP